MGKMTTTTWERLSRLFWLLTVVSIGLGILSGYLATGTVNPPRLMWHATSLLALAGVMATIAAKCEAEAKSP